MQQLSETRSVTEQDKVMEEVIQFGDQTGDVLNTDNQLSLNLQKVKEDVPRNNSDFSTNSQLFTQASQGVLDEEAVTIASLEDQVCCLQGVCEKLRAGGGRLIREDKGGAIQVGVAHTGMHTVNTVLHAYSYHPDMHTVFDVSKVTNGIMMVTGGLVGAINGVRMAREQYARQTDETSPLMLQQQPPTEPTDRLGQAIRGTAALRGIIDLSGGIMGLAGTSLQGRNIMMSISSGVGAINAGLQVFQAAGNPDDKARCFAMTRSITLLLNQLTSGAINMIGAFAPETFSLAADFPLWVWIPFACYVLWMIMMFVHLLRG